MAFWRSPHGPLGSGPPSAGYSQRRKRKEKGRFNIFAMAGLRTQSAPVPMQLFTKPIHFERIDWNLDKLQQLIVHFKSLMCFVKCLSILNISTMTIIHVQYLSHT